MSKILMITNHSYMLYRFRLELIQELRKTHEVVLSMPFVGHEEDFQALGIRCIETNVAEPEPQNRLEPVSYLPDPAENRASGPGHYLFH